MLDSLHRVEGLFYMPKNQVSVEELRTRVMKLKHELGWEQGADREMAQRYLGYVLNILDEYRY